MIDTWYLYLGISSYLGIYVSLNRYQASKFHWQVINTNVSTQSCRELRVTRSCLKWVAYKLRSNVLECRPRMLPR